tara:strand:- start:649 stop:819 length:171 start_codon:yes stop_codon:yes gene_type:complete
MDFHLPKKEEKPEINRNENQIFVAKINICVGLKCITKKIFFSLFFYCYRLRVIVLF